LVLISGRTNIIAAPGPRRKRREGGDVTHLLAVADAARIPLPDRSVDLVMGSPPYCDARTYGIAAQRDVYEWVEWMLRITEEALRVTRGAVIWVCAGVTRERIYWPACEGLLWEGFKRGWAMECPAFWHRVGISGSGGDQWFRKDVEYCLAFKAVAKLPWSDNTAMGKPPKFAPGGAMSYRLKDGSRKERGDARRAAVAAGCGKTMTPRDSSYWANDDERKTWNYVPPEIANPGNLIKTQAGGGRIGHEIAHENEAPYPEGVPEWFIRSLCPPGGICLDPFSGSGTTVSVAGRFGRRGIGLDLRTSQARLGVQRLEHPHAPVIKASRPDKPAPLFASLEEPV
jgi:site-specific DNA-methyltransferase (adenine-specific)